MTKPDRPAKAARSGNSPSALDSTAEAQRIHALLAPTVAAADLFLEEVKVHFAGNHRTVSVVVDLPENETGGVGLDAISALSRQLSDVMDTDPNDDGSVYDLEISSPGATRPLTEPRHWRRALGRMAKVNASDRENFMGRILDVDEEGVLFQPELPVKKGMKPKQGEARSIGFSLIRRGNVEVEFTRAEAAALQELELDPEDDENAEA